MGKVALIAAGLFVIALVWPELRPILVVGSISWVTGYMVGSQQTARHTAELHADRLERASTMRAVEA